jgi:transposase InsO family protein
MIAGLKDEYPVQRLCEVLDCPRSTYYYPQQVDEKREVVAAVEQILARYPYYGYRRLQAQLKRQGMDIGERLVRRVLKQLGGSRSVGQVRLQTTDSQHSHPRYPNRIKGLKVTQPDQLWVGDITYLRIGQRFFYLAFILDVFSRSVRGWHLSRNLSQDLTLTAAQQALAKAVPLLFHSDQGSQYAAWMHTQLLESVGVKISMSDKGRPTQNGIAERFVRTLKEEHVDYSDYQDYDDAYRQLKQWLEVEYMKERIHSALGYATPTEFEALALATHKSLL